jgi:MarR family transcriptional regulator, organic hydroperoxide resistance regulator
MTNADRLIAAIDPAQKLFEIQKWPFYHLARLNSIYTQRMDAALKPLGIDVPRWRVLALLQKNGACTVTQLSQEAVSKISTMTKIIQRMTAENLVTVRPSSEDARSTEVVISKKGSQILEEVKAKVSRIGRAAFEGVSPDEIDRLNAICEKLYFNLAH